MFKELTNIIKKIKGNVLSICIDDKLLDALDSNNNINVYTIFSNKTSIFSKKSKRKTNKGKNINIKKLKKYINKKSCDYIIINYNEIHNYYKYIIKSTIYLSKNIIYLYSTNDIDKEFILDKYKRYNVKYEVKTYKNGYIIKIDSTDSKINSFKNIIYFIKDTLYNIAEFIGNILVS